MAEKKRHTVLIVDDDPSVGRALERLIKRIGVTSAYVKSGAEAIEKLETADPPYALILSDQKMPGMDGSTLLERAKEISPSSVRFLITGYADIDSLVEAVNRGAVHQFITKPWDNRELAAMITAGLAYHDQIVRGQELFAVAKRKNKKLYKLNVELREQAAFHKHALLKIDEKAKQLKNKLKNGGGKAAYVSDIDSFLEENHLLDTQRIQAFYAAIMDELHDQFEDLANRNGFSMPDRFQSE